MKLKALITVVGAFVIISCSDSDENIGLTGVNLSFIGNTIGNTSNSGSSGGRISEHIEITQALVGIGKIEIKSNEAGEEEDNEFDFTGPYVVNLLSGLSDPELPLTELEPGIYNKAEAELVPVVEDSLSVLIQGMFGDTPFTFLWENTEDFKAESNQGFELTADILNNVLIVIDIHSVFEGVNFEQATINENGEIILSKDSNSDLADIVETNIEAASEIGLDQDSNGDLD